MLGSFKRLVLVLGLIFCSHARAGAQGTEHPLAFVQSPVSSITVSSSHLALPLISSVLLIQQQGEFHNGYGTHILGNYRNQNLDGLSLFQETKTSFMTESRLPVAQVWGGRLRVNFFVVTLHTGNVTRGPLASSEAFYGPTRFGEPRSADLYGIGLSVPIGRNALSEGSTSLWRSLSRIVHGG